MIRTVYELGNYVLKENPSILEGLAIPIILNDKKEQYLLIFDLDTKNQKINLTPIEMSPRTYIEYRYIGKADGKSSLQWFCTSDNVDYFLSQTIVNLLNRWDKNDPMFEELKSAKQIFLEDLGIKDPRKKRYQFIMYPYFFQGYRTETDNKKALKEVKKQFDNYLKKELHINPKDVLLYSLSINGNLIVQQADYERLVLEEKFSVFENQETGICAITNKEDEVTGKTTKLKFKYYITDKINFASGIDKNNFVKNMIIGKEAYKRILVGETYILRKFDTKFNTLPCYIIPEWMFDFENEDIPFDDFSDHIMNLVYTVQTLKELDKLEEKVEDYKDYSGVENHVSLDFLFYTESQASLKINKYLPNVPVNHLKHIRNAMWDMKKKGEKFFEKGNWDLGLNHLYYLIPMREKGGDNYEKRKILLLYESLLSNKVLSYDWLIQQFLLLAKTHMFEQYGLYQIRPSTQVSNDIQLVYDILKAQLLLKMLSNLNLLDKGGWDPVEFQLQDEKLTNYLNEMNFNEQQSSLFLLGILISKIGSAQVSKNNLESGNTTSGTNSKPILNKINYQGMNKNRLQILSSEVFAKLSQVKNKNGKNLLTPTNELLFAEHKRLFDKNLPVWNLNDRENVFYLLSGYAYGTKVIIFNSKSNKEKEAQKDDKQ